MRKTFTGLYHDRIQECPAMDVVAEKKQDQYRHLLADLARLPALPTNGSRIVLHIVQEHVAAWHTSHLTPNMTRCHDEQVVSRMEVEWEGSDESI